MDAELSPYDPVGPLPIPDGASLAGESGGGHEHPESPTCAVWAQAPEPFPGNPGDGTPV